MDNNIRCLELTLLLSFWKLNVTHDSVLLIANQIYLCWFSHINKRTLESKTDHSSTWWIL